jgi:hypothetical protein
MLDKYMRAVQAALETQGRGGRLGQHDYAVVVAGARYGVGVYDCAAQIIANRDDRSAE